MRGGQLALEERARAGQAGRRDLAVFADEIAQGVDVLVVDFLDAGDGEAAEALATEQQRLGVALGLAVLGEPTFTTWRGHVMTSLKFQSRLNDWIWKHDAATVALGARKPANAMLDCRARLAEQLLGDAPTATALISTVTLRGCAGFA